MAKKEFFLWIIEIRILFPNAAFGWGAAGAPAGKPTR